MVEGNTAVPCEIAEGLAPTISRTGVISDSTLCMTFGEGRPGEKEQSPLREIAALEASAGRELVFHKLLPSKGLEYICAYVAIWRMRLAGVEPCSIPFLGIEHIDNLVNMAIQAHDEDPASSDGVGCVVVWSMNDTTTTDAAKREKATMQGGVMADLPADLHAALFWLAKLRRLFSGMIALGCGTGELWEIPNFEQFNQQVRIVQHFLYARSPHD